MAYATDQQALHDGEMVYGRGQVLVLRRPSGFIYWPKVARNQIAMDAAIVDATTANKQAVALDNALVSSTMDELAWYIIKRFTRAIANDGVEEENAANGIDEENDADYKEQTFSGNTYADQINAVREHHLKTHRKNSEAAKRQTEAAKNRFNRK